MHNVRVSGHKSEEAIEVVTVSSKKNRPSVLSTIMAILRLIWDENKQHVSKK
jgi:hypothetical protein